MLWTSIEGDLESFKKTPNLVNYADTGGCCLKGTIHGEMQGLPEGRGFNASGREPSESS